jgi:hypothetical protein
MLSHFLQRLLAMRDLALTKIEADSTAIHTKPPWPGHQLEATVDERAKT